MVGSLALSASILSFEIIPANGSQTNTNSNQISTAMMREMQYELNRPPDKDTTFWRRFVWEIEQNGPQVTTRRFVYPSTFSWLRAMDHERYGRPRVESQGEAVINDIFTDSALDALSGELAIDRFRKRDRPVTRFGARFIEGTLSTLEPRLEPSGIEPEEVGSLQEWIDSFVIKDRMKYGVNLMNANPYAYFSIAFGKGDGRLPFAISNTRARVGFLSTHVGRPRIDEELVFPINKWTQLSAGMRIYPTDIDIEGLKPSYGIRLTCKLGHNTVDNNILYVSMSVDEHEKLFLVGLSLDHGILLNWLFGR